MSKKARISPHEMAQYRERLMNQKEFLTDILSKIEKQLLALQVKIYLLNNNNIQVKCFNFMKNISINFIG